MTADRNEALRLADAARIAELEQSLNRLQGNYLIAFERGRIAGIAELEKEALAKPFAPDWAGYRQGLEDGKREGQAERDQLRAEVEALRDSNAAKADRIDRLGEMVEELSADALRFRSIDWHWEPERDMGPGGRWWASIWVTKTPRKNTAAAAIDHARTTHKDEG